MINGGVSSPSEGHSIVLITEDDMSFHLLVQTSALVDVDLEVDHPTRSSRFFLLSHDTSSANSFYFSLVAAGHASCLLSCGLSD